MVAGDVSQSLLKLEEVFAHLVRTFQAVFFVPGNHDLYVTSAVRAMRRPIAAGRVGCRPPLGRSLTHDACKHQKDKAAGMTTSWDKLAAVQALCARLGVHTTVKVHCVMVNQGQGGKQAAPADHHRPNAEMFPPSGERRPLDCATAELVP